MNQRGPMFFKRKKYSPSDKITARRPWFNWLWWRWFIVAERHRYRMLDSILDLQDKVKRLEEEQEDMAISLKTAIFDLEERVYTPNQRFIKKIKNV